MTEPITMDIPHKYGREGVRAKLDSGVDKIAGVVPGGVVKDHRWDGDTLHMATHRSEKRTNDVLCQTAVPGSMLQSSSCLRHQ